MTDMNLSDQSRQVIALRTLAGSQLEHVTLIVANIPGSCYGYMWRSVIDYMGGPTVKGARRRYLGGLVKPFVHIHALSFGRQS